MAAWWVNQGKTFEQELRGSYLWAPKLQRDGNRLKSYEFMKDVRVGDQVFSYHNQAIRAVGVVTNGAISQDKPGELTQDWNNEGWLVQVEFVLTELPYKPKSELETIRKMLPTTYSPLDKNGNGAQKLYLSKISDELADYLFAKVAPGLIVAIEGDLPPLSSADQAQIDEEESVWNDASISETTRKQLIAARRGQGVFRERVFGFERRCRVTHVVEPALLIASHIKPWSASSPTERLDGNNGLMLSPHFDRLFDRGFMSFTDSGEILLAQNLSSDVLEKWHLGTYRNVGAFTSLQKTYLEYHRDQVFERKSA